MSEKSHILIKIEKIKKMISFHFILFHFISFHFILFSIFAPILIFQKKLKDLPCLLLA